MRVCTKRAFLWYFPKEGLRTSSLCAIRLTIDLSCCYIVQTVFNWCMELFMFVGLMMTSLQSTEGLIMTRLHNTEYLIMTRLHNTEYLMMISLQSTERLIMTSLQTQKVS